MSLSDKRQPNDNCLIEYPNKYVYFEEDVREAVRELKEIFCCCRKESLRLCVNCKDFKKIFGEKLI